MVEEETLPLPTCQWLFQPFPISSNWQKCQILTKYLCLCLRNLGEEAQATLPMPCRLNVPCSWRNGYPFGMWPKRWPWQVLRKLYFFEDDEDDSVEQHETTRGHQKWHHGHSFIFTLQAENSTCQTFCIQKDYSFILVYTDDILILAKDSREITAFLGELAEFFDYHHNGPVRLFPWNGHNTPIWWPGDFSDLMSLNIRRQKKKKKSSALAVTMSVLTGQLLAAMSLWYLAELGAAIYCGRCYPKISHLRVSVEVFKCDKLSSFCHSMFSVFCVR